MGMQLTEENYYSDIANYEYMSVSQFKDFNGTYGRVACEEAALAKLKGEYVQASSTALAAMLIDISRVHLMHLRVNTRKCSKKMEI